LQIHTVVGIGELLWDDFGKSKRPGGAPANVAFHVSQLGMAGVVISRVGSDPLGDTLLAEITEHGLPAHAIQRDHDHSTGLVTVNMDRADHPTYTIHEDVAWDHIEFDDHLVAVTRQASAICFGTLAQRSVTSRTTIQRVIDTNPNALMVYDVNLRPPWYGRDVLENSLRRCHVVKLNNEEAPVIADLLELGSGDLGEVADALREEFEIQIVCITRGEQGCLVISSDDRVDVPGCRVDIVDTVGAGDAFTAAFVCGLLLNHPLAAIARFANDVGALVASRKGATPALATEYRALWDKIFSKP